MLNIMMFPSLGNTMKIPQTPQTDNRTLLVIEATKK